jgi:hypothetical protein
LSWPCLFADEHESYRSQYAGSFGHYFSKLSVF